MPRLDSDGLAGGAGFKVGDSPRYLDEPVIGPHRKPGTADHGLESLPAVRRQRAEALYLAVVHLRIRSYGLSLEAEPLKFAGTGHPDGDFPAALALCTGTQVGRRHGTDPYLYVDAVHDGTRKARDVFFPAVGSARAPVSLAVISARTRIRCRYKHERGRELHLAAQPGDSDPPVFERSTQGLCHGPGKQGELVKEREK